MDFKLKNHRLLIIGTLLYFALAFINIYFAMLAMACMITPFILLIRDKRKTWCQGYCPRASLFTEVGKSPFARGHKTPKSFIKGNVKWYVLVYFSLNLLIMLGTTIRVAAGAMEPMNYPRFLLFFAFNGELPQLIPTASGLQWLSHLSYRFFSMMMTTSVIGLLMSLFYKPRTWCTICPVATMSDVALKGIKFTGSDTTGK
ncbi:MAG: 4Fe-4S binding protein [Clostridiaceae bacterium]|nr:4Fe-4S binding protein [Clostridiaceae bacterium]